MDEDLICIFTEMVGNVEELVVERCVFVVDEVHLIWNLTPLITT